MSPRRSFACWMTSLALASSLAAGCDGTSPGSDGGPADGGPDAQMGMDGGPGDAGPMDEDGGPPRDGGRTDGGPRDGGRRDGGPPDARVDADPDAARAYLDAVCGALGVAVCTAPWACGCETRGEPPPVLDDCAPGATADCEFNFFDLPSTLALDGLRTIDPDLVTACRETLVAAYGGCATAPEPLDLFACVHMMRSPVAIGSRCVTGGLCADGAGFCRDGETCRAIPTSEGATCTSRCGNALACVSGSCQAPVAEGGTCGDNEDCAAPHLCLAGTCRTRGPSGTACTNDAHCNAGLACRSGVCAPPLDPTCNLVSPTCGPDSECLATSETRCRPRRPRGSPCEFDDACQPDDFCDFRGFTGTCQRRPTLDERCSGACAEGLVCEFRPDRGDNFCQDYAFFGEPCGFRTCQPGLSCNDGTCGNIPGPGERCSGQCAPGSFCDFFSGTCAVSASDGETCDDGFSFRECGVDLFCRYDSVSGIGTCARVPGIGESCDEAGFCRDDSDCGFVPALGFSQCIGPAGSGELCFSRCGFGTEYCGVDLERGVCTPTLCNTLGGGIRPRPLP